MFVVLRKIKAIQISPQTVQNGAIRVQSDHSVFHSDTVDEGFLVVEEIGVGDPELVGHPVI